MSRMALTLPRPFIYNIVTPYSAGGKMIKKLTALLLAFSASPVFAFDLQSVDIAGLKEMEPAAVAA